MIGHEAVGDEFDIPGVVFEVLAWRCVYLFRLQGVSLQDGRWRGEVKLEKGDKGLVVAICLKD